MKYSVLHQKFCQISPIPESEWTKFEEFLSPKRYVKGNHLLQIGDMASEMAVILSGWVRFYYLTEKGEEFNRVFKFEGDIISAYSSLVQSAPSFMAIQAMENLEVLSFEYEKFCHLRENHVSWERLTRKLAEQHYIGKERREYQFLLMDAEARYREALETYPGIENRVPQFHLASYLGITASSLNRIIKNLK